MQPLAAWCSLIQILGKGDIRMRNAVRLILIALAAPAVAQVGGTDYRSVTDSGEPYEEVSFTVTEGTWMNLDVAPDGQTIVFDLLGDIYSLPATGGTARPLHTGPAIQRAPTFSSNGKWIAYLSDASGSDNIWISRPDGSQSRQVTFETTLQLAEPAWSPSGDAVVAARLFDTADKLHESEMVRYSLSGGAGEVIVAAPPSKENVHDPEFAPDGSLFYTEKVSPRAGSEVHINANHKNFVIKRLAADSAESETIAAGFGSATTPTLSPDATKLAFVRRVRDKSVLFIQDLTSGLDRPIFDGLDRDNQADWLGQGSYYPRFAWFPDNRHLAIWWGGKLHRIDSVTGNAAVIPFTLTTTHRLTTPTRFTQDLALEMVEVKALTKLVEHGHKRVFSALGKLWEQAGDAEPQRVTQSNESESDPAWSSDGKKLAFVSWDDMKGGSLKIRDGAGSIRTIVASPGIVRNPAFLPDGKSVIYRISPADACLGGYLGRPGAYIVSTEGGESRFLADGGANPTLADDASRIFSSEEDWSSGTLRTVLVSTRLDGSDKREHARTAGSDYSELKVSPDGKWLAYRYDQQYRVMPFDKDRASFVVGPADGEVISTFGGYELSWAHDSQSLTFALGPRIMQYEPGSGQLAQETTRIALSLPSDVPSGSLALTGARIITMRDSEVIENGTILVDGNRIVAVGDANDVAIPAGAKSIDFSGKTIMPGLVDMHGHLDTCYYASSGLIPNQQGARVAAMAFGVTTNYDPYTSELQTLTQDEATAAGMMLGPRSVSVGHVAYGRRNKYDPVYLPIETIDDAREFMTRKSILGIPVIKSYRQPMRMQRQLLIKAAREQGIMVDLEGESSLPIDLSAILDGHMALEHNMPQSTLYDDLIQLQSRSGVAQTPTLVILFGEIMGENYLYQTTKSWDDPRAKKFIQTATSSYSPLATPIDAPPHIRGMTTIHADDAIYDIGFRSVSRTIKKLDDMGALINVGSHGQLYGLSAHWEMWLMAEGGMSPHRILRAATINGARTLGADHQIGSLEEGKLADLIVLDRNPLEDIRATLSVSHTMVNGRLYETANMDQVGNHPQQRPPLYWEVQDVPDDIDWVPAWGHN